MIRYENQMWLCSTSKTEFCRFYTKTSGDIGGSKAFLHLATVNTAGTVDVTRS